MSDNLFVYMLSCRLPIGKLNRPMIILRPLIQNLRSDLVLMVLIWSLCFFFNFFLNQKYQSWNLSTTLVIIGLCNYGENFIKTGTRKPIFKICRIRKPAIHCTLYIPSLSALWSLLNIYIFLHIRVSQKNIWALIKQGQYRSFFNRWYAMT